MNADNITLKLRKVIDVLYLFSPVRTAMGVLLGIFLQGIVAILRPETKKSLPVDLDAAPWYFFIVVGLVLLHLPTIFRLFYPRKSLTESVDDVLRLIESANFSDDERRVAYRKLFEVEIGRLEMARQGSSSDTPGSSPT